MTIKEAIEEARPHWLPDLQVRVTAHGILTRRNESELFWRRWKHSDILLSPRFWQSLGKALGWDKGMYYYNTFTTGKENSDGWRVHWHHCIDHLAEGKTVESFFESLQ